MIVIGYTADTFGAAALEAGIAEAKVRGTDVLVVNSTVGDSYIDAAFAQPAQLRDLDTRLNDSGVPFQLEQPVGVFAADALLEAMNRPEAELLVIGLKHRNPVGKLLLGSVSQQILLECPKPVLAVKPQE
jgi:nucleotide-binding universal stress UspA family protein